MVDFDERREGWVRHVCPRDCPFNDLLPDKCDRYCSFALYADVLEPGRSTRTEIDIDGNVNYHIPPDCDVYERYKGLSKVVIETKRRRQVEHQIGLKAEEDLAITAHKHPAISKRHKHNL